MTYRILTDEHVERATVNYLRKLGHDVERLDDVTELGLGSEDEAIARYAREHDRLILTQDDDFFTELAVEDTSGVLFQRNQTVYARGWRRGSRDVAVSRPVRHHPRIRK